MQIKLENGFVSIFIEEDTDFLKNPAIDFCLWDGRTKETDGTSGGGFQTTFTKNDVKKLVRVLDGWLSGYKIK